MHHVSRLAMATVLTALYCSPASPQERLIGVGVNSCGTYLRNANNPEVVLFYEVWAQRYLSARNMVDLTADSPGVSLANWDGIWILIENYCRENPLEIFATSVGMAGIELRR